MDNQKPNTTPDQQNTQPDQQNTQPDQQSAKTNQQPTTPTPSKAGAAGRPRRIGKSHSQDYLFVHTVEREIFATEYFRDFLGMTIRLRYIVFVLF